MLATRPQLGEGLPLLPFLTSRLTGHRRAQSTHPLDAQPADPQLPLPPSRPPSANLASPARVGVRGRKLCRRSALYPVSHNPHFPGNREAPAASGGGGCPGGRRAAGCPSGCTGILSRGSGEKEEQGPAGVRGAERLREGAISGELLGVQMSRATRGRRHGA